MLPLSKLVIDGGSGGGGGGGDNRDAIHGCNCDGGRCKNNSSMLVQCAPSTTTFRMILTRSLLWSSDKCLTGRVCTELRTRPWIPLRVCSGLAGHGNHQAKAAVQLGDLGSQGPSLSAFRCVHKECPAMPSAPICKSRLRARRKLVSSRSSVPVAMSRSPEHLLHLNLLSLSLLLPCQFAREQAVPTSSRVQGIEEPRTRVPVGESPPGTTFVTRQETDAKSSLRLEDGDFCLWPLDSFDSAPHTRSLGLGHLISNPIADLSKW